MDRTRLLLFSLTAVLIITGFVMQNSPSAQEGDRLKNYYALLDYSCKTDSDCAVKNVGNCCGAFPACVNVNAQPDINLVQKICSESSMAGICGFEEIQSCKCVASQCQSAD